MSVSLSMLIVKEVLYDTIYTHGKKIRITSSPNLFVYVLKKSNFPSDIGFLLHIFESIVYLQLQLLKSPQDFVFVLRRIQYATCEQSQSS